LRWLPDCTPSRAGTRIAAHWQADGLTHQRCSEGFLGAIGRARLPVRQREARALAAEK